MSKTIFITGGSGFIGTAIIELATTQGYTIRALSRSSSSDSKLHALGATPVRGDLQSHDVLKKEAGTADIVINIADAIAGNFTTITPEERLRINNGCLSALADGLEGSGKPLVITSGALAVAADPSGAETNEASPRWKDSPFGQGSEPFGLPLRERGIRVCSVRLAPWVYGRGGSGVTLFMNMFKANGEVFYIGDGGKRTTTVHVEDAARLFLMVAEQGRAGEAYNATSETDVTFRQLAETIAKTLGLEAQGQSYEDTEKKSGAFLATFLNVENRGSNAKAREEFGWKPQAEKGILKEISEGSYVEVAQKLRKD